MAQGGFLIVLAVMFAVFWLLIVRPQKARQRAHQQLLDSVERGDEVVTVGGIYGDVVEVQEDRIVLEIAEDVHIEVARRAISSIVKADQRTDGYVPADADEPEPIDGDAADDGEPSAGLEAENGHGEVEASSPAEGEAVEEPEPASR